ncbi:MAG TPA: hypothetical protein DC017_01635 [Candidatus Wallbacteria bacterium]|nr:hypothetical protein [Candidatus Wallbacteria bacterium]
MRRIIIKSSNMKILHISDIHIGAKLGRYSQNDDIRKCLARIVDFCVCEHVRLLIAAGDIFDSYNPSAESEDIYYNFLNEASSAGISAVIIAGNHDNHERLYAPAKFLKRHNIMVAVNNAQNFYAPFELAIDGEKISIAAVPYVYDAQIIDPAASIDGGETAAAKAYSEAYNAITKRCAQMCASENKILVAHAFFAGAVNCGSERNIQRGNSLLVDASPAAGDFLYCAFGHLHRFQKITENAYYSGSIIPVSIDEAVHPKKMILIDTGAAKADDRIKSIELPAFSAYKNLAGGFDAVYSELKILNDAYISAVFTEALSLQRQDLLLKTARDNNIRIVSQGFDIKRRAGEADGGADADASDAYLKMSMTRLFEEYLRAEGVSDARLVEKFDAIASECGRGKSGDGGI